MRTVTPYRLRSRPLDKGRGRVYRLYCITEGEKWAADYRELDGTLHGVWADSPAEANEWVAVLWGLDRTTDRRAAACGA